MNKIKDLTGQRFGRLTAIKPVGKSNNGKTVWECVCDCGNVVNIASSNLIRQSTKSCGCIKTKNDFIVCGEYAIIYLDSKKYGRQECFIDTEDLDNILSVGKWSTTGKYAYRCGLSMHRFIMNPDSDRIIDHKNRNGLDNRKYNLRECTNKENAQNLSVSSISSTGIRGVCYHKRDKSWRAKIKVDGIFVYFGSLKTIKEAEKIVKFARAYAMPFSQEAKKIPQYLIPDWIKKKIDKKLSKGHVFSKAVLIEKRGHRVRIRLRNANKTKDFSTHNTIEEAIELSKYVKAYFIPDSKEAITISDQIPQYIKDRVDKLFPCGDINSNYKHI